MSDLDQQVVEEFRGNGGTVTTHGFGRNPVLLRRTGARSGAERDEVREAFEAASPGSAAHEARTSRVVPVVELRPRDRAPRDAGRDARDRGHRAPRSGAPPPRAAPR
ncbi:hypothetical protein [Kineococcus aurantiacus]|uniref:Uncharacterized protein n=1 Tax=Kineococcus aurantiacus TaxID=37633 RepID=A0A7Y9AUN7_9ACTN|nr:hypothetical protein [Kineococcus aurantiacus]NYD21743.1 hypothetical protein [Kineococcus aurantiacus]